MDLLRPYLGWILLYALGLAAVEIVWYWRTKRSYAWRETLVSLFIQIIRRLFVVGVTTKIAAIATQLILPYRPFNIAAMQDGHVLWGNAILLFFAVEFVYYWFHRWSHEVRLLWATHSVHHSPNSINFLTAERLSWTGGFTHTLLLFAPLVFIGFDPHAVGFVISLNLLYQYWLHTEMIPRLGPLEWFFNTPAHHRVHHASNLAYLDSNYGGVVIIFDRLFKTIIDEKNMEPIVYGLVSPQMTFNPVRIVFHEWVNICKDGVRIWKSPRYLIGYLFGPPGWSHDGSRRTSKQLRAQLRESNTPGKAA